MGLKYHKLTFIKNQYLNTERGNLKIVNHQFLIFNINN